MVLIFLHARGIYIMLLQGICEFRSRAIPEYAKKFKRHLDVLYLCHINLHEKDIGCLFMIENEDFPYALNRRCQAAIFWTSVDILFVYMGG